MMCLCSNYDKELIIIKFCVAVSIIIINISGEYSLVCECADSMKWMWFVDEMR